MRDALAVRIKKPSRTGCAPTGLFAASHVGVDDLRDRRVGLVQLLLVDVGAEGRLVGDCCASVEPLLVVQVDVHRHRHAQPQRVLVQLLGSSNTTRTGMRCTILIQLPVAFCAGSSENALPVPTPRLCTLPLYFTAPP